MNWRWPLAICVPVLLILILQYRIWFDDTGVLASWKLQQQMVELEQDIGAQKVRNEWLKSEVNSLRNGHELIEEKAREDLGFIKHDERFYLLLDK